MERSESKDRAGGAEAKEDTVTQDNAESKEIAIDQTNVEAKETATAPDLEVVSIDTTMEVATVVAGMIASVKPTAAPMSSLGARLDATPVKSRRRALLQEDSSAEEGGWPDA
eukprot:jgi/Phyca11/16699/fgenesh1_pg.PHYCAscaffold_21_\